jgi:hypothetical protein
MVGREHHFVPQFYLRNFSSDGRRINLFNFKLGRAVMGTSIKHQCSKHNFYGFAPDLEKALGELEGATAEVIRNIRASRVLPLSGSVDWQALLTFIVFQKLRTTNAGRLDDAMTDYFAKLWIERNPELKDIDPNSFEMRNVYPVAIPLSVAGEMVPAAADLQIHLLVNDSSCAFVTSDDPVVDHNQYCEGINYQGVTGWNSRGLQVFWPISPAELIVLFDPMVYKVGRSHRGEQATAVSLVADAEQLNALQMLNAHQNVYFAGGDAVPQCLAFGPRRPKTRHAFVETDEVPNAEGGTSSLVHTFSPLLPIKLNVSAISIRKKAKQVPLHTRSGLYRQAIDRPAGESARGFGATPAGPYRVKRTIRK